MITLTLIMIVVININHTLTYRDKLREQNCYVNSESGGCRFLGAVVVAVVVVAVLSRRICVRQTLRQVAVLNSSR